MKKLIITFIALGLSLVLFNSFSWAHWVIEGEGKWQGEVYQFSWEKEGGKTVLSLEEGEKSILRVGVDLAKPELSLIDDLSFTFSTLEDKNGIALSFLFALSSILGVKEEWLFAEKPSFFLLPDPLSLPPFGDCFPFRINDEATGWYFKEGIHPTMGEMIGDLVEILEEGRLSLPFWREIVKVNGLIVAKEENEELVLRVYQVKEKDTPLELPQKGEDYREVSWVDFLSPWEAILE